MYNSFKLNIGNQLIKGSQQIVHRSDCIDYEVNGLILDIDRFTSFDGPGIRTTVFVKGCPLKCIWCHSPESLDIKPQVFYHSAKCKACFTCVSACPNNAIKPNIESAKVYIDRTKCKICGTCTQVCATKAIRIGGFKATVGDILSIVVNDRTYFRNSGGGITLSGGEPFVQSKFSFNFLKACKDEGIHTAIETSGFGTEEAAHNIVTIADLIFYDIKALDPDEHKKFTSVSNEIILGNLEKFCKDNAIREKIVIRVPCIPYLNDSEYQIMNIAHYIARLGLKRIELLKYNEMSGSKYEWIGEKYKLEGTKTQSNKYFEKLKSICVSEGLSILDYK